MKKEYTIGELVSASGRRETGRRFYTEDDIIKLEQIIFYKSLGFTLGEIIYYTWGFLRGFPNYLK